MWGKIFIFLVILMFSKCYSAKPNLEELKNRMAMTSTTPAVEVSPKIEVDIMGIMTECNDTFRVEMAYLESLNTTGSFPDETDKTPKCYLRCVLEKLDILSPEGSFDTERVSEIFAGERNGRPLESIKEMADICSERQETCKCEKSYNFLKCLFTSEIEKYETSSS